MPGSANKKPSYKITTIANNFYLSILSGSDISIDGPYIDRKWKFEYKSNGKRTTIRQQPNLSGKEYFQHAMTTYLKKASNAQQLINVHTLYDIANSSDNKTVHLLICKIMQWMIEDSTESNGYCSDDSSDNYSNTSSYSNGTSNNYTCGIVASNIDSDSTVKTLATDIASELTLKTTKK